MDDIHSQNKKIANLSDSQILKDSRLKKAMNLDVKDLKTKNPVLKFDRYKNLSDKDYVAQVRKLAKTNELFQVEHLIPINNKKTASLFPKNIQMAVGRVGSQLEVMKNFVINKPNSPIVKEIDTFLKDQSVQIKGVGKNIGYKPDIKFITKSNTSEIVEEAKFKFKNVLPVAGKIAKVAGKIIKPLGIVTGALAVNTALKAGEKNPIDLIGAYVTADPEVATIGRKLREDEDFKNEYMSKLPEIITD